MLLTVLDVVSNLRNINKREDVLEYCLFCEIEEEFSEFLPSLNSPALALPSASKAITRSSVFHFYDSNPGSVRESRTAMLSISKF